MTLQRVALARVRDLVALALDPGTGAEVAALHAIRVCALLDSHELLAPIGESVARRDRFAALERACGILLAVADVVLSGRGEHNCIEPCPECRTALGALVAQSRAIIRGAR